MTQDPPALAVIVVRPSPSQHHKVNQLRSGDLFRCLFCAQTMTKVWIRSRVYKQIDFVSPHNYTWIQTDPEK